MRETEWFSSWNRQQDLQVLARPSRLSLLAMVAEAGGGPRPRVLDLACGPGAVAAMVLARMPQAHCVLVDVDPVLLRIAEDTFSGDDRVEVVRRDLREPDWFQGVGGPFDVVLSATALHWLSEEALIDVYRGVAQLLRRGGLFANSDHFPREVSAPWSATVTEVVRRGQAQEFQGALGWDEWWDALSSSHEFDGELRARAEVFASSHPHGGRLSLSAHWKLLEDAGFVEVQELWRLLDDAILVAARG